MKIRLLILCLLLLSSQNAFAAPFSDVKMSHWAYDAIKELSEKGVIQGFPDGSYKGDRTLTRFEISMVIARSLAAIEQMMESGMGSLITKTDLNTLEKLTVEFADELAILGIKISGLENDMLVAKEDVAMLKRDVEGIKEYVAKGGLEKVKLSGDMLVRHTSINHKNDWAIGAYDGLVRAGNSDNSFTEATFSLNFVANIDENITATVYWSMLDYHTADVNGGQPVNQGIFGLGGLGAGKVTDSTVYIAMLEVKNMFRFGGDFTFGRNLIDQGHSLLLNNYIDVVRYDKSIGALDLTLQHIFDRHPGNYKDDAAVDFRGVWNLQLATNFRKHDMYLGFYNQDEPNLQLQGRRAPLFAAATAPFMAVPGAVGNSASPLAAGAQSSDKRWDVEFGSKGPIGKNDRWSYDLGFVYSDYQLDVINDATTVGNPWISPDMQGWMGHAAVKWDSKKQFAAKLSYTFADDSSAGTISASNDMRYQDAAETPFEDIGKGNAWFDNGLLNMAELKLQAEYRPTDSKHYFRLAGSFLDELKDAPVNDMNRHFAGHGQRNDVIVPAGGSKTNTAYDCWNNLGIADPKATVLTFEYRYQLTENTRIRVGYTAFDLAGDAQKASWTAGAATPGTASIAAGRGLNNDYDYTMFWSEIYSLF